MAMDGILFCAYRLIFMVTSLTICNRFSFNILMNVNEYRSIFNLVCKFFTLVLFPTDVTGLKIDYFQIRNSPFSANRKFIDKNPNGFAYSNNDIIIQF